MRFAVTPSRSKSLMASVFPAGEDQNSAGVIYHGGSMRRGSSSAIAAGSNRLDAKLVADLFGL
jgi:hypothetical protein